jgi:4-aminobutyrate aminotransferase-like enzyme
MGFTGEDRLTPFVAKYKEGWFIEDVDGNVFLDWNTGWTAAPLGYGNIEVLEAAEQALREYGHECVDFVRPHWNYVLAEKLLEIAPEPLCRVFYDTTGTEVAENSVRIQREAAGPGRPFVITFFGSFHGGNYGTGAMGPHTPHYTRGVEEFVHGWINVPFPTCYRCHYRMKYPACDLACLKYIDEFILRYKTSADRIAGVMVEWIQGENGCAIPPDEWPQRLYQMCKEYDWILNNDEVQEGMGRTGRWFAIEHYPGVQAELLSLGKSLCGGLIPIACCLGSERMSEAAGHQYLGGTYAGSPAGCAAAAKTIEIMQRDRVLDNVVALEKVALEKLGALVDKYEIVGDVRVKGAYMAVEFVEDKETKKPAVSMTREIVRLMCQKGVIPIAEADKCWIRPTPALNMPPELFALGCDIVEECVREVSLKYGKGLR